MIKTFRVTSKKRGGPSVVHAVCAARGLGGQLGKLCAQHSVCPAKGENALLSQG